MLRRGDGVRNNMSKNVFLLYFGVQLVVTVYSVVSVAYSNLTASALARVDVAYSNVTASARNP